MSGLKAFGYSVVFLGLSAISLAFVFVIFANSGFVALQDFPEWIYQGYILEYISSGNASSLFYIKDYPVPYTASQLVIAAFISVFSPDTSGLLLIVIYILMSALFSDLLARRYGVSRWPFAIFLLAVFILNAPFMNGYVGYQIGIAILVGWLSISERWRCEPRVLIPLSIILFFSHGLAYVAFCIVAGVFALYSGKLRLYIVAMLPATALCLWYVVANTQPPQIINELEIGGVVQFLAYKAYTLMKAGGYHNFSAGGVGDYDFSRVLFFAGVVSNALFTAFLGLAALVAMRLYGVRPRSLSPEIAAALLLSVIAFILPGSVGGIVNPGERLLYPALILFSTVMFRPGILPRLIIVPLAVCCVAGLALSVTGLAVLPHKKQLAETAGASVQLSSGRLPTVFAHRTDEFRDVAVETRRLWQSGDQPELPLTFTTSIVGTTQDM